MAARIGKRALILYGSERVLACGLMDVITSGLAACGVDYELFGGISQNPCISSAMEAAQAARRFKAGLILAVGGGSVIDAAKAAAVGYYANDRLPEIYEGRMAAEKALPIGVVLTLAATASEVNGVSVLRDDRTGRKMALTCPLTCPAFALMNPKLTFSVPPKQTAIGAVDAFSHAFERYFHKGQQGTLRSYMCEGAMKTIIQELPRALKEPDSYEARSQLMWTATVAHSDMLGKEGVYVCHAMSHVLTAAFGMPHGMALGVLMPAWCKYVMIRHPLDRAGFAEKVWDVEPAGRSAEHVAQEGIFRFQQFICNSGLPVTLREAGITSADSAALAGSLMAPDGVIGENYDKFDQKDIQAIFDLAIG